MSDTDDRHTHATPPTSPPGSGERRTSSLPTGPIILIAIGVLLLATNLGWFAIGDLFRLLAYWPVALVAVGVDMLTNGRHRLAVVAVAIALALVLWSADVGGRGGPWGSIGSSRTAADTIAVEHRLEGARAGRVLLDLGVGRVRVDGAAPAGMLLSGTVRTGRGERVEQTSDLDGTTRVVALRSDQERMSGFNFGGDDRRWELSVSREVPLALAVTAGVGQTTLDLSQVDLTGITYRGGVGESTVTLPAGSYDGAFDLGVGSSTIRIPDGLAVRVEVTSGLGRVDVPRDLQRSGDVYTSRDYEGASERVTLRVNGGVGSITLERR